MAIGIGSEGLCLHSVLKLNASVKEHQDASQSLKPQAEVVWDRYRYDLLWCEQLMHPAVSQTRKICHMTAHQCSKTEKSGVK